MTQGSGKRPWWGSYEIPLGSSGRWRLGPFELWIHRAEREWRVARESGDDPLEDVLETEIPAGRAASGEASVTRHALRRTDDALTLLPALPDPT